MFAEYAKESSIPEIGEINPQAQLYAAMEASGMLRIFGAYVEDVLVGFATILLYVLPHYGKKIATVESLFLMQSQRKTGLGKGLMDEIERCAKEHDCVAILYSAPFGSQLERLLDISRPYRQTNSIFTRRLQ